ncbi:hypothetical protein V491_08893, partial [Pseudogymnoascus sp. VKM F-3775]
SEAVTPEVLDAPPNAPAASAFKKIFGLGGQTPTTTQAPPNEQAPQAMVQ